MDHEEVALMLAAEPESLEQLLDALQALWLRHPDVAERDRMRFEMGLTEILGNIVEHAHGPGASAGHEVSVEIGVDPEKLLAILVDDGVGLDLDLGGVQMPDETAVGGRGLALALKTLDELHYERLPGANRWRARCRRTS